MNLRFNLIVPTLLLLFGLAACGGGGGGSSGGGASATLQTITVTPANQNLAAGFTQAYTATGNYSDGTTQNLTASSTWSSSTPTVASVSATGSASALTPGSTNISATVGGITGSTPLTVTTNASSATLQTITVTPANQNLTVGATQAYTATGNYSDGTTQDLSASSTWASSTPAVASVSATGSASALTPGSTNISATVGSITGSTPVTVSANASKVLVSIAVTPGAASIAIGTKQQLKATATYSDSTTADISASASWATANSGVATVNGLGQVIAVAAGSSVISASVGSLTGKSTIAVTTTKAALNGLTTTPQTIYVGQTVDPSSWTSGSFSDNTAANPYVFVVYTVSACNPGYAAFVDANGLIVGNLAGSCSISASSGTISSTPVTLTIARDYLVSMFITPSAPTIAAGSTFQLSVIGTSKSNSQKDITNFAVWSGGNAAVTVSTGGLLTGVASGSATITASVANAPPYPTVTATTTVTVPATPPTPTTATMPVIWDNTIIQASLDPSKVNTVYPVNSLSFTTVDPNTIGVGCYWAKLYHPTSPSTGYWTQEYQCSESLVQFNLASIPAGKTIVSASLSLQTYLYDIGTVRRTWEVVAWGQTWSGATVTWKNSPTINTVVSLLQNPPAATNQIFNIDVTSAVRNWYSGAWVNDGFGIAITDYSLPNADSLDGFEFFSSEDPGGRGPKLTVIYQ